MLEYSLCLSMLITDFDEAFQRFCCPVVYQEKMLHNHTYIYDFVRYRCTLILEYLISKERMITAVMHMLYYIVIQEGLKFHLKTV